MPLSRPHLLQRARLELLRFQIAGHLPICHGFPLAPVSWPQLHLCKINQPFVRVIGLQRLPNTCDINAQGVGLDE
jgi:hypothetical protein